MKNYSRFWDFSKARPTNMTICSNQAISFSKKGMSEVLATKYIPITWLSTMMGENIALLKCRCFSNWESWRVVSVQFQWIVSLSFSVALLEIAGQGVFKYIRRARRGQTRWKVKKYFFAGANNRVSTQTDRRDSKKLSSMELIFLDDKGKYILNHRILG